MFEKDLPDILAQQNIQSGNWAPAIVMARTGPENARKQHPQSCPKIEPTQKKEARSTNDNTAKDNDGGAAK